MPLALELCSDSLKPEEYKLKEKNINKNKLTKKSLTIKRYYKKKLSTIYD